MKKRATRTTDLPIGFADHERMKTHRASPSDVGTDSAGHQGPGGRTTRSERTIVRDSRAARKTATDPLDGPVDFARFGPVRRNAFAGCGEPGGPSLLALWEMPELATDAVLLRRGRPAHGARMTTTVRSVRLPDALWAELERAAKAKHLNLHQAMRAALLGWIRRAG